MVKKWEYYVKDFKFFDYDFENGFPNDLEINDLKFLGEKGWELINIISYVDQESQRCFRYYYKKEKVD
tara:strand:- start:681 stop:884 length:204 start_codon:yes stop_codon:yes gene_type:complete